MKLISSGVMVMTVSQGKKDLLARTFSKKNIQLTEIGRIIEKKRIVIKDGKIRKLFPPDVDELYKVVI